MTDNIKNLKSVNKNKDNIKIGISINYEDGTKEQVVCDWFGYGMDNPDVVIYGYGKEDEDPPAGAFNFRFVKSVRFLKAVRDVRTPSQDKV